MSEVPDHSEVDLGESTTVVLPGHGTSGYQWQVVVPGSVKVERDTVPAGPGIGASAAERFVLTPGRRGEVVAVFKLKRSWEPQAIKEHRMRLVTR